MMVAQSGVGAPAGGGGGAGDGCGGEGAGPRGPGDAPPPTPAGAGAGATAERGLTRVNTKPTYLSRDGLEKLRAELDEMLTVRRPEVAQRIHDAMELGDLTENAEYEDATNERSSAEGRIKTGMTTDAVYIAWGPPSEVLQGGDQHGDYTTWIYRGSFLEETRYWAGRPYPYLAHDYEPRTYVRAEIIFVNGVVQSWRTLPQPVY